MPRERSPSVLDEDFHVTRRPPRFVRRLGQEAEEEQLHFQVPPSPPTPPHSVYSLSSSSDGEDDDGIEIIKETDGKKRLPTSSSKSGRRPRRSTKDNLSATDDPQPTGENAASSSAGAARSSLQDKNDKTEGGDEEEIILVPDDDVDNDDGDPPMRSRGNTRIPSETTQGNQVAGGSVTGTAADKHGKRLPPTNNPISHDNHNDNEKTDEAKNSYFVFTRARAARGDDTQEEVILVDEDDDEDNLETASEIDYAVAQTTEKPADISTRCRSTPAGNQRSEIVTEDDWEERAPAADKVAEKAPPQQYEWETADDWEEAAATTTGEGEGARPESSEVGQRERGERADKNARGRTTVTTGSLDQAGPSISPRHRTEASGERRTRSPRRSPRRQRRRSVRSRTPIQNRKPRSSSRRRRSGTPSRQRSCSKWGSSFSYEAYRKRDYGSRGQRHEHSKRRRSESDEGSRKRRRSDTDHCDHHQHRYSNKKDDKNRHDDRHRPHDNDSKRKTRSSHKSSSEVEPEMPTVDTSTQTTIRTPTLKLSENEILRLIRTCREPGCNNKEFDTRKKATSHLKEVHDRQLCFVCFHSFSTKGVAHTNHFIRAHAEDVEETALCPVKSCSQKFGVNGIYVHLSKAHLIPVEEGQRRRRRTGSRF